jgi:nucleotide-binding universal stress UspA family protein
MKRIRTILHATDFSRASASALAQAVALAKPDRARLFLLHVLVPPSPFLGNELPASYLDLQARARRDAERRLAAAVATAKRGGARVQAKLVGGAPVEEVIRAARRWRPNLIVIGTHGRTGLGRLFMGSVAERVLQRASGPVLTVRGGTRVRRARRILHASDFSRASGAAFAQATEMARANRAELLLAHVLTPPVPMADVPAEVYAEIEASTRAAAQKQLDRLAARAKQAGVRTRTLLLEGIAAEQITKAARSRRADLVAIGTHGRTGLAKFFLGSVAGRVVSTASCPVLTVRGA